MAAVVDGETNVVLGRQRGTARAKDAHVCPAEAIDGLLRVSNRGEMLGVVPGEERDELELLGVGVLELVDHHEPEATGIVGGHTPIVTHGMQREAHEVIVVEERTLLLESHVSLVESLRERDEMKCG